jgi:HEPN domain-containing protein
MADHVEIARQWVAKARNDLLDADNNLASKHVPTDTVCYHCQQAAEKRLKAVLAAHGIPPPRTHLLLMLLDAITPMLSSVETLRESLVVLTPYAISTRYPVDDLCQPAMDDAREARRCAENVVSWLREQMPDLLAEVR